MLYKRPMISDFQRKTERNILFTIPGVPEDVRFNTFNSQKSKQGS